jgi:hypothetical protein
MFQVSAIARGLTAALKFVFTLSDLEGDRQARVTGHTSPRTEHAAPQLLQSIDIVQNLRAAMNSNVTGWSDNHARFLLDRHAALPLPKRRFIGSRRHRDI